MASQTPQNIFHNLSSTVFGSSDLETPAADEKKPHEEIDFQQDASKESLPIPISEPQTSIKDEKRNSVDNAIHSEAVPPPAKDESPKVTAFRSRSSSTFGALQKWLQLGSDGPFGHFPSSTGLTRQSSVLEASKSLVKEKIQALSSSLPATTSSATQTSPVETCQAISLPTVAQFSIGSGDAVSTIGTSEGPRLLPLGRSPKFERKHIKTPSSFVTKPKSRREREKERSISLMTEYVGNHT